jgi:hypothetical protein
MGEEGIGQDSPWECLCLLALSLPNGHLQCVISKEQNILVFYYLLTYLFASIDVLVCVTVTKYLR